MKNDETIKLYIPKELVKEEDEHPEFYGEGIVVLQNGMWTDVYSDENGNYYSYTNDDKLIAFVQSYERKNKKK